MKKLTKEEIAKIEVAAYIRFHERYEINADFTCKEELDEAYQEVLKETLAEYKLKNKPCDCCKEDHSSWE